MWPLWRIKLNENFYRLLCSQQGSQIAQIAVQDSHLQRIAKALHWIKEDFQALLSVRSLHKWRDECVILPCTF